MSQYIRFECIEEKPKTKIYDIINIHGKYSLGIIKWYSLWRQYCFFPDPDKIWNSDCLQYIVDFLKKLNKKS